MVELSVGDEWTSITMSRNEADFLARELHYMDLEESGHSVLYKIYDALVPMGDDDDE